jgi:hypothetical protein
VGVAVGPPSTLPAPAIKHWRIPSKKDLRTFYSNSNYVYEWGPIMERLRVSSTARARTQTTSTTHNPSSSSDSECARNKKAIRNQIVEASRWWWKEVWSWQKCASQLPAQPNRRLLYMAPLTLLSLAPHLWIESALPNPARCSAYSNRMSIQGHR